MSIIINPIKSVAQKVRHVRLSYEVTKKALSVLHAFMPGAYAISLTSSLKFWNRIIKAP